MKKSQRVKEFLVYFKEFYGPKGIYSDTIPRYTQNQVLAGIISRGAAFEGDTVDRELIRDSILALRGKSSEHSAWLGQE